jgi:hypothetical protein
MISSDALKVSGRCHLLSSLSDLNSVASGKTTTGISVSTSNKVRKFVLSYIYITDNPLKTLSNYHQSPARVVLIGLW